MCAATYSLIRRIPWINLAFFILYFRAVFSNLFIPSKTVSKFPLDTTKREYCVKISILSFNEFTCRLSDKSFSNTLNNFDFTFAQKTGALARLVLEVSLEGSARKLVTVRSALLLRNLLPHPVELRLDRAPLSGQS